MAAGKQFQEQINYLGALEKKVRRLLLQDENTKAIILLKKIIQGYREIGAENYANTLEEKLELFLAEQDIKLKNIAYMITNEEETQEKILFYIESLEKKIKRRLLQGRTVEAITDLRFIIAELRRLKKFYKADLLEETLEQFIQDLSGDEQARKPLDIITPTTQPLTDIEQLPTRIKTEEEAQKLELTSFAHLTPPLIKRPSETPRQIQSTEGAQTKKPRRTIKDEPLSEEEILVKKLLEIKELLADSKKKGEIT
ncbi:MAG: hypothetical protein ACTSQI_02765 [Candidatus Helarchaeota archaeon]